MRRDRAERRAREYQALECGNVPNTIYYAYHKGRNRWVVCKRLVNGDRYEAPEEVER